MATLDKRGYPVVVKEEEDRFVVTLVGEAICPHPLLQYVNIDFHRRAFHLGVVTAPHNAKEVPCTVKKAH